MNGLSDAGKARSRAGTHGVCDLEAGRRWAAKNLGCGDK